MVKKAVTGGLSYYIRLEECEYRIVFLSGGWRDGESNFAPQGTFGCI